MFQLVEPDGPPPTWPTSRPAETCGVPSTPSPADRTAASSHRPPTIHGRRSDCGPPGTCDRSKGEQPMRRHAGMSVSRGTPTRRLSDAADRQAERGAADHVERVVGADVHPGEHHEADDRPRARPSSGRAGRARRAARARSTAPRGRTRSSRRCVLTSPRGAMSGPIDVAGRSRVTIALTTRSRTSLATVASEQQQGQPEPPEHQPRPAPRSARPRARRAAGTATAPGRGPPAGR